MKIIASIVLLLFFTSAVAAEEKLLTVVSAQHRVSLLELYSSEGCSSCPPADKFLSGLRQSGVKREQLIPLAFHVTYWDYIGWKDPYASLVHDNRQRKIAQYDKKRSIYTPQFVFNGSDYRHYDAFDENIQAISAQLSEVDIVLNVARNEQIMAISLKTDSTKSTADNIAFYFVLYENKLSSHVLKGENSGVFLQHDYVVRKIQGPFTPDESKKIGRFKRDIELDKKWKIKDMGVVAFAQNLTTGEILQAVELKL